MEDWGESYKKASSEEALLMFGSLFIKKRGNEKHSNREISVCDFRK